jgi:predicted MFS family arabinose efflux permease
VAESWYPVLRHRAVRQLWTASAATAVVVWISQIAVTVTVLRDHSVATLALVGLIGSLPSLIVMPIAGTLADRYDVRRLALTVVTAQVVCLTVLGLIGTTALVPLTILYALHGALAAFWPPARQQWLYGVVPPNQRHPANSAIGSINGIMTLVGAALGGLLSAWDPRAAILVAAVLQIGTLIMLAATPAPPRYPAAAPARFTLTAGLRDGIRAARDLPLARSVIWIGIAWGLIGGGYNVLLAGRITEDLGGSAVVLGLVYVADGVSVIVATLAAGRIPRRLHLPVYAAGYVVQGVAWAVTFAVPSLAPMLAALVVMRLASGVIIALDTTILLDTVPDDLRGRISSLHMTTYNAVARISLAGLGAVLAVTSLSSVGVAAGVASAVFGACWWWWSGRPAAGLYRSAGDGTDNRTRESA